MHQSLLRTCAILLLSFLGIADAAYLTKAALSHSPLSCSVTGLDGCNTVAQSAYAHFLGLPIALYGIVFYVLVFLLAAITLFISSHLLRSSLRLLGLAGFLASLIFVSIQLFLIHAICIYCMASAGVSLLLFIVLWWPQVKAREKAPLQAVPTVLP